MTTAAPMARARRLSADEQHLVRVTILRALQVQPYLATALHSLQPVIVAHGKVTADERWRLLIDPDTIRGWTVDERAAVLLHTVNHLLRDHGGRRMLCGATDQDLWNLAADAVVNADQTLLPMPGPTIRLADVGGRRGETVEEIYARLYNHPPDPHGQGPDGNGCGGCATGGTALADPSTAPAGPAADPTSGATATGDAADDQAADEGEPGHLPDGLGHARAELVRRRVAQEVQHARSRGRDDVPRGLTQWADSKLAPPSIDWRRMLAATVRDALRHTAGRVDFTYRRPSRRRIPRVILPSMQRPVPNVVTILDTSGSMDPQALSLALGEIEGICKTSGLRGGQHHVACVDADVASLTPVNRASDVTLAGGGGTDMRVGIQAAIVRRPRPDVVIVLTDGYTPWPADPPPRSRLIIGLINDAHGTPGDPADGAPDWATVIRIPTT